MTFFDVLRHQWRRTVRAPTWGRSLIGGLVLGLVALYFGGLFVAAGWFFPQGVAEVAPQHDPLVLLNEGVLYGVLGLILPRFLLQRSAGSDVRAYLPLPLRRGPLVRMMQALSALSLFNVLPLLVGASLWASTVLPAAPPLGAACWAVGFVLVVAATQFANSLLRAAWDRHAGAVVAGVVVLGLGLTGVSWLGVGGLGTASAWLFGGLAKGAVAPMGILAGGTGLLAGAAHRALRQRLYGVVGAAEHQGHTLPDGILRGWGRNRGQSVTLALLDAKLILRNKRPRQMLGLGLPFMGVLAFLLTARGAPPVNEVLFNFLLSGYMGMTYIQFGYAWHGRHFDALRTRAFQPVTLVRAKVLTVLGLNAVSLAVFLPVMGAVRPETLPPLAAFFLYHLGGTTPFLLLIGVWLRTPLELDRSTFFNYQGTSTYHFWALLPVIGIPFGGMIWLGEATTVWVVAGLGVLGLVTIPLWTRGIGGLLHRHRHAMASAFRSHE